MCTVRLSLMGTIMLALVGGSGGAVVAQAEAPSPVTYVAGTVAEAYTLDAGDADVESDLASYDLGGYEVTTQTAPIRQVVEWSDPRLPTDLWLTLGFTLISAPEDDFDGAMNVAWQSVLEDEVGRWRGTGRSVQGPDEKYSLYTLTGEGAYKGLSALLRGTTPDDTEAGLVHAHAPWDMAYEGYIFEADLTPYPAAPVTLMAESVQIWPMPTE